MAGIQQADSILARLKADGVTQVGSLDELMDWIFASKERLLKVLPERDVHWLSDRTGIPTRLMRVILYSRQFIQALFDELHYRKFNILEWDEIYNSIIPQLKDPNVPLGAKRSMLEFLTRQMGLDKPRKLSVKQQSEVVVRVERTDPAQVLEVLGVPVDAVSPPPPPATSEAGIRLDAEPRGSPEASGLVPNGTNAGG